MDHAPAATQANAVDPVAATVPAWLEQLRGSLETGLAAPTADQNDQKSADFYLQAQINLFTSMEADAKSEDVADIPAPSASADSDSNVNSTSDAPATPPAEPYLVQFLTTRVLDELKPFNIRDRFGKMFTRPRADSPVNELKKYESSVRAAVVVHEKHMIRLNMARKRIDTTMKEELAKWDRWAMEALCTLGQTYFETCRLHLDSQIEIEVHTVDWLNRILAQINARILQNNTDFSNPGLLQIDATTGAFVKVEELVLPEHIATMKRGCQSLQEVLEELATQYEEQQRECTRVETAAERRLKLANLISIGLANSKTRFFHSFYYHDPDKIAQTAFNRLMLDERQRAGQLIKQWMALLRDALKNPVRRVTAEAINAFLEYLVTFLIKSYNLLRDTQERTLRLFVHRMIFPRITRTLNRLQSSNEIENDAKFRKKIRWMWRLSQEQIGISQEFRCTNEYSLAAPPPGMMTSPTGMLQPQTPNSFSAVSTTGSANTTLCLPNDFPFFESISLLSTLEHQCVPTDMLFTLTQTISSIQRCCRQYSGRDNADVSADDLFPIAIWVVVHAHTPNINSRLGHILRFVTDDKQRNLGESGFSLAIIEATISYILNVQPSKFGLPFNVDDDPDFIAAHSNSSTDHVAPANFGDVLPNDEDPFS